MKCWKIIYTERSIELLNREFAKSTNEDEQRVISPLTPQVELEATKMAEILGHRCSVEGYCVGLEC